jgi:hypothetical protein
MLLVFVTKVGGICKGYCLGLIAGGKKVVLAGDGGGELVSTTPEPTKGWKNRRSLKVQY